MKEVKLTKGKVALVDDEDYEWLNQYSWHASGNADGVFYARGYFRGRNVKMHRLILGILDDLGVEGEHIDGDGFNNQRSNLRVATRSQNGANRKGTGVSKYRGVSFQRKRSKPWMAAVQKDKQWKFIGRYHTEKEAAEAYNRVAAEIHGEFAYLNKIEE